MRRAAVLLILLSIGGPVGAAPLQLAETIPLPEVHGRLGRMAVDTRGGRLFLAAHGNDTVEVVDLAAGRHLETISGLRVPQGVLFLPEFNRLYVTEAAGRCVVYDGTSLRPVKTFDLYGDADEIRYDPDARRVYVGYGQGGLAVIDAAAEKQVGDILLAGHPESFQLEPDGPRIFVNIPPASVALVDRGVGMALAAWPLERMGSLNNYPMALDARHRRLFVVFRQPAELVVFNADSGEALVKLRCAEDADGIHYDAPRQRIYVSGGRGVLSVIEQANQDYYRLLAEVPVPPGARSSLFVPELNRLYLAVPSDGRGAAIHAYDVQS